MAQAMAPDDARMLVAMHEAAGRTRHDIMFVVCHSEPGAAEAQRLMMPWP